MQGILTSDMEKMLEFTKTQMMAANKQLDAELAKLPKETQEALKPLLEKVRDISGEDTSSPQQPIPEIIEILRNGSNNK